MSLADLGLRTKYVKGQDDIASEFYMPCMGQAVSYDRAVGFFSSAIYVIAWPSLREFVLRGSVMRLICCPVLSVDDIEAMGEGYGARQEAESGQRLKEQIQGMLASPSLYKPTKVLASLVALGVVDIRIAFMERLNAQGRIFHDKLGLFFDHQGNTVAFKGSMNETWSGLSADGNLESVDVFVSWEHPREAQRVKDEEAYFLDLWENRFDGVKVRKFPEIAREELINAADLKNWPELVDDICKDMEAARRFVAPASRTARILRPHQSHALLEWEKAGRRGIFEHATGSGKTFTALSAARSAIEKHEVVLVLVPSELLLEQWRHEISSTLGDLDPQVLLCGAGNTRWRTDALLAPWTRAGTRARIVISTMQTAVSQEFQTVLRQGAHLFLIADEVHRLGSEENKKIFTLETGARLGLSATPRRAGDPSGTASILAYFNGVIPPPFTLRDAIACNALTPYLYYVHTALLSVDEQDAWNLITTKIKRYAGRNAADLQSGADDTLKRLLIERARIVKGASRKPQLAREVLCVHYKLGQRWIVYCDNVGQLNEVLAAVRSAGMEASEYHSAMTADRGQTLRYFEHHGGILISIRCLDEGVDIPSVSHALILASSRNPREFIQRRGRVLRRAPGKGAAFIHDVIVLPQMGDDGDSTLDIVSAEMARAVQFGRSALNPSSITDLERIALHYGMNFEQLATLGYEDEE